MATNKHANKKPAKKRSPKKEPAKKKPAKKTPEKQRPAKHKPAKKKPPKSTAKARLRQIAERGARAMGEGDYENAVAAFEMVLASDPNDVMATYGIAYAMGSLAGALTGKARRRAIDHTLEMAQRLIELTPEDSLWPYVEEHKFGREALRTAYNALAWWGLERARGEDDLMKALAHIEHGLRLVSPIDNPDMLGYWDTKVRILLRLGRSDEAYEIVSRNAGFDGFADIVDDPAYAAWRRAGGNAELLDGREDETPREVLVRLQKAIAKLGHPTYAALVFSRPVDMDEIARAEQRLGARLPPSYVELVTRHGLFKLVWDATEAAGGLLPRRKFDALEGCRALLSPAEIARETLEIRKAYAEADDPETASSLGECLVFQENYYRDNFFVFRYTDGAENGGECSVHDFFHDDALEWRAERVDFAGHLRDWVASVLADD